MGLPNMLKSSLQRLLVDSCKLTGSIPSAYVAGGLNLTRLAVWDNQGFVGLTQWGTSSSISNRRQEGAAGLSITKFSSSIF